MNEIKVLLFIVEGPSDEQSLAPALESIIAKNNVKFKVMHTDITSDYASTKENIEKRIKEQAVKKFLNDNTQFNSSDICGIVHIVDTDGVFIPDTNIKQGSKEKPFYDSECIYCKDVSLYQKTRSNKRDILKHLSSINIISIPFGHKVPYSIYYMSCNLDHVLHNKKNSTEQEKKEDSLLFSDNYDDPIKFEEFFNSKEIKVPGTYSDTWNYIAIDLHSLKRGSNFWLCINKYKSK